MMSKSLLMLISIVVVIVAVIIILLLNSYCNAIVILYQLQTVFSMDAINC